MAVGDPIQWVIIGVIVLAIFLWGPQKIPDIAKALGRARKEFDDASKGLEDTMSLTPSSAPVPAPKPAPMMTGDQMLIDTARQIGISTEGKTREQISQEIIARTKAQAT